MRIDGSLRNDLNVFIESQYDLSNSQPSLPTPQRKERDDLGAKTSLNDTKVTINTDTPTWNEASLQRLFAEEFYILTFNEANKQLEQNFRKELDDLQIKIDNRLKRVENLGDAKANFDKY